MVPALLVVLLSVPLPAPFGEAEASALEVRVDGSAVLEVSVEVTVAADVILVRGVGPVDELPPVALLPREDGTWGGLVELATTDRVLLAFELIPPGGGQATISDAYTLIELGVDPAALAGIVDGPATTPLSTRGPQAGADASTRWGWLALGAGAGGVALLLLWLWMGREEKAGAAEETDGPVVTEDVLR
jgi:hypothetical protein